MYSYSVRDFVNVQYVKKFTTPNCFGFVGTTYFGYGFLLVKRKNCHYWMLDIQGSVFGKKIGYKNALSLICGNSYD